MICAYDEKRLYNLLVIKEAKRWSKHSLIEKEQLSAIGEAYKTPLYHPNLIIRVVLFVATSFALSGVTGLLFLTINEADKNVLTIASFIYGIVSFLALEKLFLKQNHYKSGVTEAIMYQSCGFVIGAVSDFNTHVILVMCLLVFLYTSIRYLDFLSTLAAMFSFAGILFYEFYNMGGIFKNVIPFIFILSFTPIYFIARKARRKRDMELWSNNLLIVESLSLLFIYAGGNYMVVRELSASLLDLQLEPGQDIPFAFVFYALTVLIPLLYLYFGIKNKDVALLRVSLVVIAFSVFTFKYYYSLAPPEIAMTVAGMLLLGVSVALLNYLKTIRHGYTRENLLSERWGNLNAEAFIISQTMGGNKAVVSEEFKGGGGEFGGGGASGKF